MNGNIDLASKMTLTNVVSKKNHSARRVIFFEKSHFVVFQHAIFMFFPRHKFSGSGTREKFPWLIPHGKLQVGEIPVANFPREITSCTNLHRLLDLLD